MIIENRCNASDFRLTVLGTRGSIPREGKEFALYGGSTSCYLIRAGNEAIYLDAGSGIAGSRPEPNTNITILLTHMHLDHLLGLPFFAALGESNKVINIYARGRSGLLPKQAIDRLISVPFWPCKISDYPAKVNFHILPKESDDNGVYKSFNIGDVAVDMMEGTHPGGSTIYRLTYREKSIVYATDFEHIPASGCEKLEAFAANCDLLLYDAQYTEEEYNKFRGYGHSTPQAGLKIANKAGAAKLLFVHHAPWRNDETLISMENEIKKEHTDVMFAKIGDEFIL